MKLAQQRIISVWSLLALSLLLSSCGGGGSSPAGQVPPSIQSISPTSAVAGTGNFSLTITGSNFLSTSVVGWNGAGKPTTFVSTSQLTANISATDIGTSGTAQITVTNPSPGGGQATASFTVSPPAQPVVASVSPNALNVGGAAFTLTVNGSNFVPNSVVQWNGASRTTTYVNNTQLTAAIATGDLTSPSTNVPVSVNTPGPGGGSSNNLAVEVEYPLPSLSSLIPSQVIVGSDAFTLTVNGSNFVNGATVYWNNISRVTQYVSPTQLKAVILASDLVTSANQASVTVQNPSPSAGISNVAPIVLATPAPQITSINPTSGVAGAYNNVTITGSGFVGGSMVQVGSQVLGPNFQSTTSLQVSISTTVGPVNLAVVNPPPSAGPSNTVVFTATAGGPGVQLTLSDIDPSGNVLSANQGALSSTGRYSAFYSDESNGFTGYIRDTCFTATSGCKPSTSSFQPEFQPILSPYPLATGVSTNGRYVSTFVPVKYDFAEMYFTDSCLGAPSGCTPATNYIGRGAMQGQPENLNMTPNGRYVTSWGILYDSCVGAAPGCTPSSVATPYYLQVPSVDARYIVYSTGTAIVLHDTCLGAAPGCAITDTTMAEVSANCSSGTADIGPTISSDAEYIAWGCSPTIYMQSTCLDKQFGCVTTPLLVISVASPSDKLSISDGGRFLFFDGGPYLDGNSQKLNLVYVYDSCNGVTTGCVSQSVPISSNSTGALANAQCALEAISTDGKYVLFNSRATNLLTVPANIYNTDYIAQNPLF